MVKVFQAEVEYPCNSSTASLKEDKIIWMGVINNKNAQISHLRTQLSIYQEFYAAGYEIYCVDGVPVKRPKAMKGKD